MRVTYFLLGLAGVGAFAWGIMLGLRGDSSVQFLSLLLIMGGAFVGVFGIGFSLIKW